jgi:ribonuclease D
MTEPSASGTDAAPANVLAQVAQQARAANQIALDTEFMGEGRYRTLLCLIQLAVPDGQGGERIEIVDPLDVPLQGQPLAEALANPRIEVVVHAGRQDIALLRRTLRCEVSNIFDTQVAAGFLGMPAQSSYDTLLAEMLGVRLAKSASFTRWDARPLSAEQLSYAREDVVHLTALAAELERRLGETGRLQWAREECEFLEKVSDERNLDAIFARLPRVRGMSAHSQNVARELVAWRERTAQERDKPVQSVLSDATLVEIAKRKPTSARKLEDIRGVAQNSLRKRGSELLEAVQRGLQASHEPLGSDPRPPQPRPDDVPLIALCEALVRARAREAGLAYELLAARADLQAIVIAQRAGEHPGGHKRADVRTLRGWRAELVGNELLDLLNGQISLSVKDRRVRVATQPLSS